MDITNILNSGPREKIVRVCLRPDLAEAYQAAVKANPVNSLAGASTDVAEAKNALDAATIAVRLRKVPRRQWDALMAADHDGDEQAGADAQIKACAVEPELADDQWEQVFEALTSQDYNRLYSAVLDLNARAVELPN